jgi:hypothetical protein
LRVGTRTIIQMTRIIGDPFWLPFLNKSWRRLRQELRMEAF